MKIHLVAGVGLIACLAGCGRPAPTPPPPDQAAPVALVAVAGWRPLGEAVSYGADDLWQLVDGAADQLIAAGCRSVRVQQLEGDGVRLELQLYDMGAPDHARRVLAAATPGIEPLPIGDGAVVSPPYQVMLASGPWYVTVDVLEGALDDDTGRALAADLAATLGGAPPPA